MHKFAGKDLYEKMVETLGSKNEARDWFYTPQIHLSGKRPYDCCMSGESWKVKRYIIGIDFGVYL